MDGVRVQLILGPTGSGKSVTGNVTIAHEQKYGGFTYIFDIGGSYESVVELYGGRVDRIGKDGPRVNPFTLEPTENNIQFLYSFIKLLLTNGGAELEPEDDDVMQARHDAEERQRQQALAQAMQQLQQEQDVPGPESDTTPPMTAAQRASIYGDSPNAPQRTSNMSEAQAEAKQKQLAIEKQRQDALNSDTVAIDFCMKALLPV